MTDEQIRVKIAKLVGYQDLQSSGYDTLIGLCPVRDVSRQVPDYPHSLDACLEFESKLTREERWNYTDEVHAIWARSNYAMADGGAIFSPAIVRCEAFLRMKGEWK